MAAIKLDQSSDAATKNPQLFPIACCSSPDVAYTRMFALLILGDGL